MPLSSFSMGGRTIVLGISALVCAVPLLFIVLSIRLYRRVGAVCDFIPVDDIEAPPPYMAAMIAQAEANGFKRIGSGKHFEFGLDQPAALMIGTNARTIALISAGKGYDGTAAHSTRLYSQLSNGGYIVTRDDVRSTDLDPKSIRQWLYNGSFSELLSLHENTFHDWIPFPAPAGWPAMEKIWRRSAQRTVDAGLVRYVGEENQSIHLTLAGLYKLLCYAARMDTDPETRSRRYVKRPDSRCPKCGYDLRASEGRCPECGNEIE